LLADQTSAADLNREGERTHQVTVPVRCVSITCPAARTLVRRPFQQTNLHHATLLPTAASQLSMLLPSEYLHLPASGVAAKLAHTCSNHFKASLTKCSFHPNSARIVTGNKNGEMAIWELHNGFKFQKQFSAHHQVRLTAMVWSHNEELCITGDANGVVKCVF
jgi:WD40 repeat protein